MSVSDIPHEKKAVSLWRHMRLTGPTDERIDALSVLFGLPPTIIEKMFRGKECALLFNELKEGWNTSHKKKIQIDFPQRSQPIPGENSTKKLYKCIGGCGRSRLLTDGEARRKGYTYACPRCAQLVRGNKS